MKEASSNYNNQNSIIKDYKGKTILSNNTVLAFLIRNLIEDFKEYKEDELIQLIEESKKDHIPILSIKDEKDKEGIVEYDILLKLKDPKSEEISVIINLEHQNKAGDYASILDRAHYYLSRLISSQKNEEFNNNHYEKIKKVYSIWILMNPNKSEQNKILQFTSNSNSPLTSKGLRNIYYPKENIIILNLSKSTQSDTTGSITQALNILFYSKNTNKAQILKEKFHIIISDKEEKQMTVYEESTFERGREEGSINKLIENYNNLLSYGLSESDITKALKLSDKDLEIINSKLKKEESN